MFEYVKKTLSRKAGRTKEIVNISAPIPIMVSIAVHSFNIRVMNVHSANIAST